MMNMREDFQNCIETPEWNKIIFRATAQRKTQRIHETLRLCENLASSRDDLLNGAPNVQSAPKGLLLSDVRKAKKDFKSW